MYSVLRDERIDAIVRIANPNALYFATGALRAFSFGIPHKPWAQKQLAMNSIGYRGGGRGGGRHC